MSTNAKSGTGLLPAGLRDLLPPEALAEAKTVEALLSCFALAGYERVKPPLIEFEESLLSGGGAAMAPHTFRIMDPVSQRMMGVRADMTLQVARLAVTRLSAAPRPLRLAYAGQVLRVKGSQLRPERQFTQIGIELIGAENCHADCEVIVLAAEALASVGVAGLSLDLTLPTLIPTLLSEMGIAETDALRQALDRKDRAEVAGLAGKAEATIAALLDLSGPIESVLPELKKLSLPTLAAQQRDRLVLVAEQTARLAPDLALTIDAVENRGYSYHTGVCFTLFARGLSSELGRGGRYLAGECEAATGFSLFMDSVLSALPLPQPARRIFVPADAPIDTAPALRRAGWVAIRGLDEGEDATAQAKTLSCGHLWVAGTIVTIEH